MKKSLILLPLALFALSIVACNNNNQNNNSNNTQQNTGTVSGVSLNYEKLTMYVGKSATLSAVIEPENASNKEVSWSSSDTSVADVDGGVITGVAEGEATIKAKCGGAYDTCVVTVTAAN